jgi:hypothetical protein
MSKPKNTSLIVECAKHGLRPCDCATRSPEQKKRDGRRGYQQRARARAARAGAGYTTAHTPHASATAAAAPPPTPPTRPAPPTPPAPPASSPAPTSPPPAKQVWSYEWVLAGEDIAYDIQKAIYDGVVDAVHADGSYPAGYVEIDELVFANVDREHGTADISVTFSAEHWSEDYDFPGTVVGSLRFAADADVLEDQDDGLTPKERFLESLELVDAVAHFDME